MVPKAQYVTVLKVIARHWTLGHCQGHERGSLPTDCSPCPLSLQLPSLFGLFLFSSSSWGCQPSGVPAGVPSWSGGTVDGALASMVPSTQQRLGHQCRLMISTFHHGRFFWHFKGQCSSKFHQATLYHAQFPRLPTQKRASWPFRWQHTAADFTIQ